MFLRWGRKYVARFLWERENGHVIKLNLNNANFILQKDAPTPFVSEEVRLKKDDYQNGEG